MVASLRGRGSSSGRGTLARTGSGDNNSVVQVENVDITVDQQLDEESGAAEPFVDSKVAEAAASMERVTIQPEPVVKKGTAGKAIPVTANYIRLELTKGGKVYEYEVNFQPTVDSRDARFKLIKAQSEVLGVIRNFDGVMLCLPILLPDLPTVLHGQTDDQVAVKMTVTLKHARRMADKTNTQFFNILFRRIMGKLKMKEMNRNFYDPSLAHMVPQHKLEIWPGYVTAVAEYEGGLMLNLDVSHKVLRNQTAYELMADVAKAKPNSKDEISKALMGAVVLTRYNNQTYIVDDVAWDQDASDTFKDDTGREKSFVDYYRQKYNIDIKDKKQLMLVSRAKRKTREEEDVPKNILLVPELCKMTGLTDQMRSDFRVMKDVAQFTRVTPMQRLEALKKFVKNVNDSAEASALLLNWGLELAPESVQLSGRHLTAEKLLLGKNMTVNVNAKADWGKESTSNQMLVAVDLRKWVVVYVNKNEDVAKSFVNLMTKLAPKMGMRVGSPDMKSLPNDRTETYLKTLRESIKPDVQVVTMIMPTPRDDRYAAVKKLCCVEMPVPSQVINYKTLANEKKASSVVQKVALQINCKLGGELWGCQMSAKFGNLMVVGVDVFHDPARRGSSIAAVVTSVNKTMSSWYSTIATQNPGQELVDCLKIAFVEGLKKYYEVNHFWPDKVIVFRDGVGDSQLDTVASHEAEQFVGSFKNISADFNPGFAFIVVQKRINTRIFHRLGKQQDNPPPGTVLDHTVTKRNWYDFFLVSQHVGQGTVTPTHYVVVQDTLDLPVDAVQRISYKLTHMYFNWPGTVRVPAPCQYAHKLAYQVGEHLHREPSRELSNRLFFL